jgi:hypothetical protein
MCRLGLVGDLLCLPSLGTRFPLRGVVHAWHAGSATLLGDCGMTAGEQALRFPIAEL